jgi:GxxExxY protein
MAESVYTDLSKAIIGAAIEVHRTLGPGFLESVYEMALAVELEHLGIPFLRQVPVELGYRGRPVGEGRIDMIVDRKIVVELKAVEKLLPLHEQQLLSYLKVTGHRVGLLINFNVEVLNRGVRRVVHGFASDLPSP